MKGFLGIVAALLLVIAAVRAYDARDRGGKPAPLAQGRQAYTVWSGEAGPKITEVVVDPFDPRPGERQTMEVAVQHPTAVREVRVLLRTDRRSSPYALALASGAPEAGRWAGSWETTDLHDRVYRADITAAAADATSSITLTFR